MTFNKVELKIINISSKFIYGSLILAFASMLALPAHALGGNAWGGKCIHVRPGGSTTAVACGDGASCTGSGMGGSECTIGMKAITSKALTPNAKSADPSILKGSAPKQPVKK